jgi:hypothetical protein
MSLEKLPKPNRMTLPFPITSKIAGAIAVSRLFPAPTGLIDSSLWKATSDAQNLFNGCDLKTGELKWIGIRVDLIFGSNSQLRALVEVYGCEDSQPRFVHDFVAT